MVFNDKLDKIKWKDVIVDILVGVFYIKLYEDGKIKVCESSKKIDFIIISV